MLTAMRWSLEDGEKNVECAWPWGASRDGEPSRLKLLEACDDGDMFNENLVSSPRITSSRSMSEGGNG